MERIRRKVFEFAYGGGLVDATRQQAFKGPESQLRDCVDAMLIVREYIDRVLNKETADFYKTAKAVEECFAEHIERKGISGKFSFGNAQKLINMTVKNMYTVVYIDDSLRESFRQCHCPMDNIMIDRVLKELDKTSIQHLPKQIAEYMSVRGWRGRLRKPWSQIEFYDREQYEVFQAIVRFFADLEGISPIEYDYLIWDKAIEE